MIPTPFAGEAFVSRRNAVEGCVPSTAWANRVTFIPKVVNCLEARFVVWVPLPEVFDGKLFCHVSLPD